MKCDVEFRLAERALTKVLHDAENSPPSLDLVPTFVEACVTVAGGRVEEAALELEAPPLLQQLGLVLGAPPQLGLVRGAPPQLGLVLGAQQVQPELTMEDVPLKDVPLDRKSVV